MVALMPRDTIDAILLSVSFPCPSLSPPQAFSCNRKPCMSLQYTSAHSSRIKKSPRSARSGSTTLRSSQQNSSRRRADAGNKEDDTFAEQLPDTGLVLSLYPAELFRGVVPAIQQIQESMFSELPERALGMNSTRISAVLNHRVSLPRLVSLGHIHAVTNAPTTTERELAKLVRNGLVRRISVPGRGRSGSGGTDMVVLVEDVERMLARPSQLTDEIKQKYLELLRAHPGQVAQRTWRDTFSEEQLGLLMQAGFLVVPSQNLASGAFMAGPDMVSYGTLSTICSSSSQAASGSIGAVGGDNAIHDAGGGSGSLRLSRTRSQLPETEDPDRKRAFSGGQLAFSLPSTGSYLRLASSARAHLMSFMSRCKFKEAPVDLLRHRWDGGVAGQDPISQAKRARGEFAGVLPGATRKWRTYHGLRFEWVLGECVAAGLLELFETGTIGRGVRVR